MESDPEVFEDSLITEDSFVDTKKQFAQKSQTVFVAESEESVCEDEDEEEEEKEEDEVSDPVDKRCVDLQSITILSSDDGEMSPEVLPKRRPPVKAKPRLSESFIGRKTKKRMIFLDSDTDNSFITEQKNRGKQLCLKDTPAKIEINKIRPKIEANMSFQDDGDSAQESNGSESDTSDQNSDLNDTKASGSEDESINVQKNENQKDVAKNLQFEDQSDDTEASENEDESLNVQKNENRKEKDIAKNLLFEVQSKDTEASGSEEESNNKRKNENQQENGKAKNSQLENYNNDTEASLSEDESDNEWKNQNQQKKDKTNNSQLKDEDSRESSVEQVNEIHDVDKAENFKFDDKSNGKSSPEVYEVHSSDYDDDGPDEDQMTMSRATRMSIMGFVPKSQEEDSDDSDLIIESDDKSPKVTRGKVKEEVVEQKPSGSIKPYLVPASFPNQVVYVKKHVRENEMSKLNGLREELQNIRYLLEHMELEALPDGGARLIERLTALEADVRRQGDKVANMIVEPDSPTAEDIRKDGFSKQVKEPTWEDIQKASNEVQPKMFGKQALATHMAERNLIMDGLKALHLSLDTRPPEHEHAEQPAAITTQLMPHQLHALAWLRWRETQRPRGGILADDMGLGKTITMIALIALGKEKSIDNNDEDENYPRGRGGGVRGGTLVVCPASLVQQWADEVRRHAAPHRLAVALHHGASRAAHPHRLAANDLVLTTYNILQRENEKSGVLTKVTWRRVILDEAHVVRNHKSATSNAVCALKAACRWALTGTPLHNKDLDLFALLKFLKCTPFDDLTMWKKWIDNKSFGGEQRLNMIMRCLLLRRTKAQLQAAGQLACLPPRSAHDCPVRLSPEEMAVYQKVLVSSKTLFAQYLHQRAEKRGDGDVLTRAEKDNAYALHKKMVALRGVKPVKSHEILVLLLRLRQMCCHCGLIAAMLSDHESDSTDHDPAEQDLLAELDKLSLQDSRKDAGHSDGDGEGSEEEAEGATVAEAIRSSLSLSNPVFKLDAPSAKIAAVMKCLETNVFPNKGEKAVVVSQWTSVLRLVAARLAAARVRCVTLSGAVPVPARAALVQALNDPASDVRVMLLSLCAGGVGLNLCGANHLLLLDPHWNPQLEQQAQDRVYRVGQAKHVHIYRFMCVDTVEQSIRNLQKAKLEMAENVLTGARNTNASKLTIDDLKVLFNMGPTDA